MLVYVVYVSSFTVVSLLFMFDGVIWDLPALRQLTAFGWCPGEAYYSGTGRKKKDRKEKDKTEEQKK